MSYYDHLDRKCIEKLNMVGFVMVSEIRKNLNRSQPYKRVGGKYRGLDPSKPGEFPKKLSGQLLKSIAFSVNPVEKTVTVGTNMKHGKWLEFGTVKMKAREYLVRTYRAVSGTISRIFRG